MLIKNEFPILEHDTDPFAVIAPTHEGLELRLPKTAVYAFLGKYIEEYASAHGAKKIGVFDSETKDYPLYLVRHRGEKVLLCQAPVGAAGESSPLKLPLRYVLMRQ